MRTVVTMVIAMFLVGCAPNKGAPLVVTDVVINRPIPGMNMSAGYLALTNTGEESITISRINSAQFELVEIHESLVADGVSRMRPVGALTLPPGQTIRLEPGGKHLMLMRPTRETDVVTLELYSGDDLLVSVSANFVPTAN